MAWGGDGTQADLELLEAVEAEVIFTSTGRDLLPTLWRCWRSIAIDAEMLRTAGPDSATLTRVMFGCYHHARTQNGLYNPPRTYP